MSRVRSLIAIVLATAVPAVAADAAVARGGPFVPSVLALPDGWQPEGIASGGGSLFVGSIPTGAVYRLDAKTGRGAVLVAPRAGERAAIGLKASRGKLFVAGGPTGRAFVYDAETGADVADIALTAAPTFVNDVVVTKDAAWFTDSQRPQLYRVAVDRQGTPAAAATTVPITGDLVYDDDPSTFEANGIVATNGGRTLLVVQSATGKLFRIDAATGVATEVPLRGGDLANGDGLLLVGRTLLAVQNRLNRIAVVKLDGRLRAGRITRMVTDPDFAVPTTIARLRGAIYAVNARFGTPPTPDTPYTVVRVDGR